MDILCITNFYRCILAIIKAHVSVEFGQRIVVQDAWSKKTCQPEVSIFICHSATTKSRVSYSFSYLFPAVDQATIISLVTAVTDMTLARCTYKKVFTI